MTHAIREFVLKMLRRKGRLPNVDIDSFNYIDSGHIDSIGIIKFLVELESEFGIEISENDMLLPEFKTVGGLVSIINEKVDCKGQKEKQSSLEFQEP